MKSLHLLFDEGKCFETTSILIIDLFPNPSGKPSLTAIAELILNKIHIKEYSAITLKETMANEVNSF